MKRTILVLSILAIGGAAQSAIAAPAAAPGHPVIGEVRVLANPSVRTIADMHSEGWLEARGELLPVDRFPELFAVVGRSWTTDGIRRDRFAVPRLQLAFDRTLSSDNPYGVLGPGDLVRSSPRRASERDATLTYWIFTGRDVRPEDIRALSSK